MEQKNEEEVHRRKLEESARTLEKGLSLHALLLKLENFETPVSDKLENAKSTGGTEFSEEEIRSMFEEEDHLPVRAAIAREIRKRANKDICLNLDQARSLKADLDTVAKKLHIPSGMPLSPDNPDLIEVTSEAARTLLGQWIAHVRLDCKDCIGHLDFGLNPEESYCWRRNLDEESEEN
jgi:hypothetical protein